MKLLENALPKRVDPNSWIIVGNVPGYGNSSLIKEFGSQRRNGPVLFTDFSEVAEPAQAKSSLLETISPLFCDPYPFTIYAGEFLILTFFTLQKPLTSIPIPA